MKEVVIALLTTMINSVITYPTDTINKKELIRGLEIDLDYIADLTEEPFKASKTEDKYIRELEDENENLKRRNKNLGDAFKNYIKVKEKSYEEIANKNNEILRLKKDIVAEKTERERQIAYCKSWQKKCMQLREKLERYEGK
jgi:predicted  nucleic acid-binding Zn-ribbon protein